MIVCAAALLVPLAAFGSDDDRARHLLEQAEEMIDVSPDSAIVMVDAVLADYPGVAVGATGAVLHVTRGEALFAAGRVPEAMTEFKLGRDMAAESADTVTMVAAVSSLGVAYRVSQQPDSALVCYTEALDLLKECDAPEQEAHLLTSIAILFANSGRFADAVPYAMQAMDKAEEADDMDVMMYAGSTAGIILYNAGDKNGGIAVERRIVDMAQAKGAPRYTLKAYASIIDMHYKEGNTDSVYCYMARGRELLPQVPEGSVEALGFMEESYVILTAMRRYAESLDIQKRILAMKDAGTFMPIAKLHQRMARNYRGLGDISMMECEYERAIELADSLHGCEVERQLSEFDVRYNTARRELEIARLEADVVRGRMALMLWIAGAVVVMVAMILWIMARRRREKMRAIRERLDGIEQERARLARELHDGVCNDLLGIGLLMQTSGADREAMVSSIERVRDDVRHISHELMPPQFANMDIDELLRDYAASSGGFVEYRSEGSGWNRIPGHTAYEIYRIVQELVGNIRSHTDAGGVEVAARLSGDSFVMDVTHHGMPLAAGGDRGTGIGMQTVGKRCALIHAQLSRQSGDGTEIVRITLGI